MPTGVDNRRKYGCDPQDKEIEAATNKKILRLSSTREVMMHDVGRNNKKHRIGESQCKSLQSSAGQAGFSINLISLPL